jgi:hypothetical protein
MNIVIAVSWTDIPTEVMATSTICNQDSVRICSLDVYMNNTDEKLLLYCRCLETLTFTRYWKCRLSAAVILSGAGKNKELTVPHVLLWLTFFTPTEMLPVERVVAD